MSLKVCHDCAALYAATLEVCPQCQATVYGWSWEEEMPKATVEGGGSDYSETPPPVDEQPKPKPAGKAKAAAKLEPVTDDADD